MFIMSKEEYKKAVQELNVNLARLGATDDLEELKTVYVFVRKRLEAVYRYRYWRLNNNEAASSSVQSAAAVGESYIQQQLFNQDK